MKAKQSLWQRLCATGGWSVFTMFVWELIEEGIESLIAVMLSSALALFLIKAISTLGIVVATQTIKVLIKRFLYPCIKTLTYKEGNDKMNLLKKYWTKVWGNKITGAAAGIGFAGLSYFQTIVPFAHHCWWIALIMFVVFYNIAIFFGGETLGQIQERLAQATLKKEEQAIIKEAKKKLAQLEKVASQTETEKAKAEADAKAKAEHDAKVQEAMAKIKAEQSAK